MNIRAFAAIIALSPLLCLAQGSATLGKKLIEYGWDVPFADYVAGHIDEMQKRPFDGLIFKLRGGGRVLTPKAWSEDRFAKDYAALQRIDWGRFTDNFIIMWAASDQDWFDDAQWKMILGNVRLVARAARIGHCVGLCFDQEPYGKNPWSYQQAAHRGKKSFAEYRIRVRQRGAQFMRAVESEFPGATILTFFQLSYFDSVLKDMDPQERMERISTQHYALLPAFLNGMLDAASPRVRIIDGNERAYYYTSREDYFAAYHTMRQRAKFLIDPKLWETYNRQVQAGYALYIDQYFGLRKRKVLGHFLRPEERPLWFEHNVYWALYTTDKYVWCYSEKMNWWLDRSIPPGCEQAIRNAREKLAAGKPLGFDLAEILAKGKQRQEQELAKRLIRQTATIPKLKGPAPRIDGVLSDPLWTTAGAACKLRFRALAGTDSALKARTEAMLAYDNSHLYVAFRCREPTISRIQCVGELHDDNIWAGDDVELQFCPGSETRRFVHLMVNPQGLAWDGFQGDPRGRSYNPPWQHATRIGTGEWTAEFAIPWKSLGLKRAPQPGEKHRGNLCRQRRPGHELSAWSPMAVGFLEHAFYGTFVFGK